MSSPAHVAPRRQYFHSLTGLRFILAIWIAYFHVGHMYDHGGFGSIPVLELGVARVDIFFVLSGFVLAHIYIFNRSDEFRFGDFMVARISRLYPLHLFALGLIGVYLAAGILVGRGDELSKYPVDGLLANIFMIQGTVVPNAVAWNFPAWAISAEFAGYLLFPFYVWLADQLKTKPLVLLGLAILAVGAMEAVHLVWLDRALNQSTAELGILRGAVVIMAGVAARCAFENLRLSGRAAIVLAVFGTLFALLSALGHVGTMWVAAGACAMIIGLAQLDHLGQPTLLSGRTLRGLGDWAYAIFILHVPIFVILKNGLDLIGTPFDANIWTAALFTLVVIVVSWPVHRWIEEPCRKAIRQAWDERRGSPAGQPKGLAEQNP